MLTLSNAFKISIGYSDHTKGIEVPIAAVALGAKVIEKHFTLDKNMEGPDHLASTEPDEFKNMVEAIRNIEVALGTGEKTPQKSEIEISKVVTKRCIASKSINVGDVFSSDNVCVKRNDVGFPAKYWDLLIGKNAQKAYEINEAIEV